jgi:hypothetical protein
MDRKQRVNKKQNTETDSSASSGDQGKYMKYVSFSWPPFAAALTILKFSFFSKNNSFEKN